MKPAEINEPQTAKVLFMRISIKYGIVALFFLMVGVAQAQDNPLPTEHLIIIKPYSPTVSDANKAPQNPMLDDSLTNPKKVPKYTVISVPVASTFVPEKGKAAKVETGPQEYLYDNYAVLGFGNYTRILGELYSNFQLNDYQNLALSLAHNSTQGGADGTLLDDKYYRTELGANFSSHDTYSSWGINFGAEHQLANWYGAPEGYLTSDLLNNIDPQQNYFGVSLGGNLEYYEGLFEKAGVSYRYFGDSYGSSENHLRLAPEFRLPVADQEISLDLAVDYVGGSFDHNYYWEQEIKYSNFHVGAHPSITIQSGDLSVDLGAEVVYAMDLENEENDFFIYPKVKASYQMAGGYFVPYAGADGGLEQNTYYNFVQQNPFVSPTLQISPTNHIFKIYLGAKGKFTEAVGYDFNASYGKEKNKAFFVSHPYGMISGTENYHFHNSFGLVYDDLNSLSLHGELNASVNENLQLRLNASYFSYETDTELEAWNLPEFKATLNGNYQITEKWSVSTDLFFVGQRKERQVFINDFQPFETIKSIDLDSYFDVNLQVGYKFNEQLSAFLKGNNLLGDNYERWHNFPVLGTQVMAGVGYKFDW